MYYNPAFSIGFIIGAIVMAIVFGCITKHINENKGYSGGFAWGFWLGWIGIIVVACRSPYQAPAATEYRPMYGGALAKPEAPSWTCACGSRNPGRLDYCPICRRSRADGERKDVRCPHCGAINNASREFCVACNKPMKQIVAPATPAPAPAAPAAPAPAAPAPTPAQPASDDTLRNLEVLEKLAQLHREGILSDEEYAEKKNAILSKF